jgi:hypothetical protein
MNFADLLGSIGVTILLVAFALNLRKLIETDGIVYLLLNFCGAGLSCSASVLIHYYPFVVLEAVWTLVSLVGIVHWTGQRRRSKKDSVAGAGRV